MTRNDEIHQLRIQDWSYQEIGKKFGISGERVRQIESKNRNPILKRIRSKVVVCKECGKSFKLYLRLKVDRKFCSQKCKNKYFKKFGKFCKVCGSTENLEKNGLSTSGRIFYMCRECNTKRYKKWSKSDRARLLINKSAKNSAKRHPRKQRARSILNCAVQSGKIVKPSKCEICGNDNPEGHHKNYNKPLEVMWVCRNCHSDLSK